MSFMRIYDLCRFVFICEGVHLFKALPALSPAHLSAMGAHNHKNLIEY